MAAATTDDPIAKHDRSRSPRRHAGGERSFGTIANATSAVLVKVSTMSAEHPLLETELALQDTIATVKERVNRAIELPTVQQQLVFGTQVVEDSQQIRELVEISKPPDISVMLTLVRVKGIRALTGSEDHTLRVWGALELPEVAPLLLSGHLGAVCGAEVDWESGRALSGAREDRNLRLWSLEQGELLKELQGHSGAVYGMSVDWGSAGHDDGVNQQDVKQRGARALSWGCDRTLILWDLELGNALHVLRGPTEAIHDAEVDWKKSRALSWSGPHSHEHVLWFWDLARGTAVCTLIGWGGSVESVDVNFKLDRAISWGCGQAPLLWDLTRGEPLLEFGGHVHPVSGVSVDWEQKWALTWSSEDSAVRLWNWAAGMCTQELQGHPDGLHSADVNWDQRRAVTFGADHAIWLWSFQNFTPARARVLGAHEETVAGVEVNWEDEQALSWGDDGNLQLFDISEQGTAVHKLQGHSGPVWCANVDWSLQRALSWSYADSDLLVWDLENCEALFKLSDGPPGPWGGGVEVNWEQQCAMRWSNSTSTAWAWDLKRGILMRLLLGHTGGIMCADLE